MKPGCNSTRRSSSPLPNSSSGSAMAPPWTPHYPSSDVGTEKFLSLLNEERPQWDKSVTDQTVVATVSGNCQVVRSVLDSSTTLMRPREFVEKRIRCSEGGVEYAYCSSVPDNVYPIDDKYERCTTLFAGTILHREGSNYIYNAFSQVDLNVCPSI